MNILLTNDDNYESPFLMFLVRKLKTMGNLVICVPSEERSCTGKGMTITRPIAINEALIAGHPGYTLSGLPADCANIGIYHLFEGGKPDVLISGINVGLNSGLSFMLSSGTVGACFEANIARIPAIALSQDVGDLWEVWHEKKEFDDQTLSMFEKQIGHILDHFFDSWMPENDLLGEPVTWNVNFPFEYTTGKSRIERATLGETYYENSFVKQGHMFSSGSFDVHDDDRPGTDYSVLKDGNVSVTRIDVRDLCKNK